MNWLKKQLKNDFSWISFSWIWTCPFLLGMFITFPFVRYGNVVGFVAWLFYTIIWFYLNGRLLAWRRGTRTIFSD